MLSEAQSHNFEVLSSASELRFGEKCTKEYSRLQLKSRYQKAGESLQELATDIQRLSDLAFLDYQAETCEDLALQHFIVCGIQRHRKRLIDKIEEAQQALR